MTRHLLLLALAAVAGHAAVIRGMVVEGQTGRALMRATVMLQPVPGTPGNAQSARTNRYGAFEFGALAPGAYILRASRRGFMSVEYGQKRWNSAGTPIVVGQDTSLVLNLQLPRYGAITGTVRDENDVGIPDYEVVAYRNTQPPQLTARGKSDERGIFRITALEPGAYLVRSAALQDEEIAYLPTFSPQGVQPSEARPVTVYMDEESRNADVQPVIGRLFSLSGRVTTQPPFLPVIVTLSSEMGRQTVNTVDAFQFAPLPPGDYELHAEAQENARIGAVFQAAYAHVRLAQNTANVGLSLQPVRETTFDFAPDLGAGTAALEVTARRRDLAGAGESQTLKMVRNRAQLTPGRWELKVTPPSGYYVVGFAGPSRLAGRPTRADGWNETTIGSFGRVWFTLSGGAAGIHGVVKSGGDAVPAAPVFLEGYDPVERRPVTDIHAIRADMHGAYRFDDLAPGTYRILATFEYQMPDAEAMDYNARTAEAQGRTDLPLDLDLYVIR
jgi:hypothetical protein